MSVSRSWTLHCDGCGESIGSSDLGDRTAAMARRQAKYDGAHVNLPGGRDVCGDCWDAGVR